MQHNNSMLDIPMTDQRPLADTIASASALDSETLALVRLAGVIAAGTDFDVFTGAALMP